MSSSFQLLFDLEVPTSVCLLSLPYSCQDFVSENILLHNLLGESCDVTRPSISLLINIRDIFKVDLAVDIRMTFKTLNFQSD